MPDHFGHRLPVAVKSGTSVSGRTRLPAVTLDELRRRGHQIEELSALQSGWGPVSIIEVDGEERRGAADPRVDTTAALVF